MLCFCSESTAVNWNIGFRALYIQEFAGFDLFLVGLIGSDFSCKEFEVI